MNTISTSEKDQAHIYLVHLAGRTHGTLTVHIQRLAKKYELTVINGDGTNFQTIRIAIQPFALRNLLQKLPKSVLASYELLESETC